MSRDASRTPIPIRPPGSAVLWRYLSFAKFADLLLSGELYFNRIDRYEDPLEGTFPISHWARLTESFSAKDAERVRESQAKAHDAFRRKWIYTSCWHEGPNESYALWKAYASSDEMVAICTTVGGLSESLEEEVRIGRVEYIDFESLDHPWDAFYRTDLTFWHKHIVYSYEHEVRALVQRPRETEAIGDHDGSILVHRLRESAPGFRMSVDLRRLVQGVTVSPFAPVWLDTVVERLLRATELPVQVSRSGIRLQPSP